MDETFLVATHVSSISSLSPTTIVVTTTRQNVPLSSHTQNTDLPVEHAICSATLSTATTGTLLLRLIHGGLMVELSSLSANIPPIRFVLPAIAMASPALFLWEDSELHILLVTEIGSLHRLIIPIDGTKLWQNQTENIWWPKEYAIQNITQETARSFNIHAQGTHCVAISMPNGALLRLEAESMGYDVHDEDWTETLFQHGSFLSSLTAFLPLHSSSPGGSDIISLASHPWPTDIGNIWTLSRDRTLRLWKAKLGCVASKTLPMTPIKQDHPSSTPAGAKYSLLDADYQRVLNIFSLAGDEDRLDVYVIAFIPTPSASSGGFFCLFDTSSDQLLELGMIECSKKTAHCHLQDFMVNGNTLYTLWDRRGQSMLERAEIDISLSRSHDPQPPIWRTSQYTGESELTPAHMEEQLLSPGSLTAKFLEAIMKPGTFSSLTLRTALDKYIESCLSVPGPPPPQLLNTYATLSGSIAAVVGCTVTLNRDPMTGGFQHANYWTALKRDWEGFLARCREVERNARWPLVIGAHGANGVVVIERERVASLVAEDVSIALHRMVSRDLPLHPQFNFLAILWGLRSRLNPRTLSTLETRIMDIMRQEIAFSFAEILQDQARHVKFEDDLEGESKSWFESRLETLTDVDAAIRVALDSVGAFDLAVKREESESGLSDPHIISGWERSQVAAYTHTTINARYDLSLSLIIFLLFVAEELPQWDASLLAEVFAVFRGIAMLRYVASQPVESPTSSRAVATLPDDVVARMRNMHVSNTTQATRRSSLLDRLILSCPADDSIPSTAHNFLDSTGVLRSLSPAHVTKHEILFCHQLLRLGFSDVTQELLSWLPRTPAATFLQSQVWLEVGRADDAAEQLEKLAGCFGVNNLTLEDSEALMGVLPNPQSINSQYSFYLFASGLFHDSYACHEVYFAQLALQVGPPGSDTTTLRNTIIKGLMDLGLYEDAYATVMTTPYEKLKRDCASQLALRMCDENTVDKLMAFDFAGIANEVEGALSFKSRNSDPRARPSYSRILYTWYTRRGDYRNASLTMFQRARKLQDIITDPTLFVALAEDQLEALSIAINSLYLVEEKMTWILLPVVQDLSRKRLSSSARIPESKYLSSKHDAEVVHLSDMEYESLLLRAQIDIIKREPTLLSSPEYLLPPPVIVMRLAQNHQYNQAMSTARSLKVDMTDIFIHLTNQCVRLSRNPGAVLQEDTSGWLLTDNAVSWAGTPSDRGWRYLQLSLKRHDGDETDHRYAKASLETILSVDRSTSPPRWLIDILEKYQTEYLIRVSLRYEIFEDAVNYAYTMVLKSDKQLSRNPSQNASTTWLPYALIDQVLVAAEAQMNPPLHLSVLKTAINSRVKRMQKSSQRPS